MMKKCCMLIAAAATAMLFSGCRGYQGFVNYDSRVDLSRENEKLTGETTSVRIENGTFKVEKLQTYTYIRNFRVDTRENVIYTEGGGVQVFANFVAYPIVLAVLPLQPLVMEEKVQKAFGREYTYSKGRQYWNMLNPFICTTGTFQQKEETVASEEKKEECTEIRHIPIREGQIELICGDRKKIFPVGVTLPEIGKTFFDAPLPPKTAKITAVFCGKAYPLLFCSTEMLSREELAAWKSIQSCRTPADAVDRNILQSLALLKPHIDTSTYETEKKRLTFLSERFQFPLCDISDDRLPISKDYVSGTALRWIARKELAAMGEDFRRNPNAGAHILKRTDYTDGCEEFRYTSLNSGTLIFSRGEALHDNTLSQAVLIRRELEMPDSVTLEMVVAEIAKKNPGVTIRRDTVRLGENSKKVPAGYYGLITVNTETLRNIVEMRKGAQKWLIVQTQIITNCTGNSKALEAAGVSRNAMRNASRVSVTISDCNFEEAFENAKTGRQKQSKEQELRREREIQQRALDQI